MPDKFNELLLKPDIIELYNAGITPNYGYLMNGRFEKDMVKTLYPLKTLSGNPIAWEASETEYLFPTVSLEPKQAGSGDPSPENVRPITGWDEVAVNVRGKNLLNPDNVSALTGGYGLTVTYEGNNTVHITGQPNNLSPDNLSFNVLVVNDYSLSGKGFAISTFNVSGNLKATSAYGLRTPTENSIAIFAYLDNTVTYDARIQVAVSVDGLEAYEPYQPGITATLTLPETIYGGTVDAVTGVGSELYLFKELAIADMNHVEAYPGWSDQDWVTQVVPGEIKNSTLAALGCAGVINITPTLNFSITPYFVLYLLPNNDVFPGLTQSQIKEQYPELVVQFCLKLVTPEPFQATGNQQLTSFGGYNTMYSNGDSITLKRKARRLEV